MTRRYWAGNCRRWRVSGCEEPARVIISKSDSRKPPGAPADGIPVEPQSCAPCQSCQPGQPDDARRGRQPVPDQRAAGNPPGDSQCGDGDKQQEKQDQQDERSPPVPAGTSMPPLSPSTHVKRKAWLMSTVNTACSRPSSRSSGGGPGRPAPAGAARAGREGHGGRRDQVGRGRGHQLKDPALVVHAVRSSFNLSSW